MCVHQTPTDERRCSWLPCGVGLPCGRKAGEQEHRQALVADHGLHPPWCHAELGKRPPCESFQTATPRIEGGNWVWWQEPGSLIRKAILVAVFCEGDIGVNHQQNNFCWPRFKPCLRSSMVVPQRVIGQFLGFNVIFWMGVCQILCAERSKKLKVNMHQCRRGEGNLSWAGLLA